ncbi:MAG TPA: 3-oxoacyl-[acyl-carrier-protein] reductase [Chitinophagaceae bacterium]|nr:3-oxoacyl-[acyl-carrier-protein] reductase [Chitinophagaceae bacterium]
MEQVKKAYALVTGGSRGIGSAICLELSKCGYHVLINYQSNKKAAEETLEKIENEGGSGTLIPFDVSKKEEVRKALSSWEDSHPNEFIEVLVNNAGVKQDALMVFMEDDQWEQVVDTNLNGMYWVTKQVLTKMVLKRKGKIVNIASISGLSGTPGQTNYASAKGGMIAASKSLAQEVGARGITVNVVAPGFVETDMTEDLDAKTLSKNIPLRRFGKKEEVAHAVSFLISDKAAYITGQVLQVNGGLFM